MKHLRLALTLLLLFAARPARAEDDATSLEYGIKAVVLFNFAKYVEWPTQVFSDEKQGITVYTVDKNPVATRFNSSEAPTEAQGRPFVFKEVSSKKLVEESKGCQILYWQEGLDALVSSHIDTLHENSVLTVSDSESGRSAISFTKRSGKIRFIIRRSVADKAKLSLGSQLLKLAILEDK